MSTTGVTQRNIKTPSKPSSSSSSSSSSRPASATASSSARPVPVPVPVPVSVPSYPDDDGSTWLDVILTFIILTLMALSISYITTQTLHFGLISPSSSSPLSILSVPGFGASAPASTSTVTSPNAAELAALLETQANKQTHTDGEGEGKGDDESESESESEGEGENQSSGNAEGQPPIAGMQPPTGTEPKLGADGKPRKKFRRKKRAPRTFTLAELNAFDGSDPDKPIYISIKGHVYDVSDGKQYYSKGHGYNVFAGRDCTRAFVTGCFKERYPGYDLRGVTPEQMKDIDQWLKFYEDHATYFYVGELILPVIKPDDPLPNTDCSVYDEPGMTPISQSPPTATPPALPILDEGTVARAREASDREEAELAEQERQRILQQQQ